MATAVYKREELVRAYQVLGARLDSTSHTIKQAYRAMVKRWHPDSCAPGSAEQEEATRMMTLINEAYGKIERAPLRYDAGTFPGKNERTRDAVPTSPYQSTVIIETVPVLNTDRIEFWVRFAMGAFVGLLVSIDLVLNFYEYPVLLGVGVVAAILGIGFASARFGDRTWHSVMKLWWLRP
jgi:hypothetical protein